MTKQHVVARNGGVDGGCRSIARDIVGNTRCAVPRCTLVFGDQPPGHAAAALSRLSVTELDTDGHLNLYIITLLCDLVRCCAAMCSPTTVVCCSSTDCVLSDTVVCMYRTSLYS